MRLSELLIRQLLVWLGLWALCCVLIVFSMGQKDVEAEYASASALVDDLHRALEHAEPLGNIALQRLRQQLAETKAEKERRETRRELLLISSMLLLMAAGSGLVVWFSLRPTLNCPLQELVQWLAAHEEAERNPLNVDPCALLLENSFRIQELKQIHDSVGKLMDTLHAEQQKSRDLLKRVIDLQERERQTIAQDLHDYFGQSLTSISVNSAFLVKGTQASNREAAQAVHDQALEMMTWLRTSLRELKPHLLLDVSLRDAALDLVDNWSKRHGWYVDFAWPAQVPAMSKDVSIALYRTLQEALHNASRHAKTKGLKVLAGVNPDQGEFVMIVQNDGVQDTGDISPSLGLTGIRERISNVHGRVFWQIREGSFVLTCHVPTQEEKDAA